MTKTKFFSLTASLALATTLTLSCGEHSFSDLLEALSSSGGSSSSVDNGGSSSSADDGKTVVKDEFTDSRDGQVYKTVKIGTQTWLAQNLNYAEQQGSKCYRDYEGNCEIYGRLYNWETAMKACPSGWHLPTDEEWITLCRTVGGSENEKINSADLYVEHKTAGAKLKAKTGWLEPDDDGFKAIGTDEYGFSALPGGWGYLDGDFGDRNELEPYANVRRHGSWWSATSISSGHGIRWSMENDKESVTRYSISVNKKDYRSVRCVKD
jgi:uncharacterized protein (TIGR02145 family)